jgi:hypothetical protein
LLLATAILFFAASAGNHPAVRVDTHEMAEGGLTREDEQQLRGSLLVRLVDEGYVVAPGDRDVPMWLTVSQEPWGWSVDAGGPRVHTYHVDAGPLAVLSLEILQRATMALNAVREDLAARDSTQTVSKPALRASMVAAQDFASDRVAETSNSASESRWRVAVTTSAGILARSGGVDPTVQARVDLGSPSRFGGRLQASTDWSTGPPPLSIMEWQVLLGPTWSLRFDRSLTFTTGVLSGILLHQFYFDANDSGSRVDWNLGIPAELSYRFGWATIGMGILAGVTQRSRDHQILGESVWQRGPDYLGVTAGLGVVL